MVARPQRIGPYEVIGVLARGGMAELFVAQRPGDPRRVAIKRVLPELTRDPMLVELFRDEAVWSAALEHPNIVRVLELGRDGDGEFLAMELLHGTDVATLLGLVARDGRALPIGIAVEIARAACAGLHHAHERTSHDGQPLGLIHRDVSPSNVFVTYDGVVKLLDFGIAKARTSMARTRTGGLRGKIPYMSPEQCRGEPLDRRSDVYALAIVLWEMTVGERLYDADSELATLKQIVDEEPRKPSALRPAYPAELERIVLRGLARDRAQRYASADELQGELEAYARGAGAWCSPRDLARFMAEVRPEPAHDAAKRQMTRPLIAARETTPLVAPAETAQAAQAPTRPADAAPAPKKSRPLAWLAIAMAALAAIALGFALGQRRTPAQAPGAMPSKRGPAVASTAAPEAAPAVAPEAAPAVAPDPADVAEDAQWFQPDDYLVHRDGYTSERLDWLWPAKQLAPPAQPGGAAPFLDVNGVELTTTNYWRTRRAQPRDLVIGAFAFCRIRGYEREAGTPPDRQAGRIHPWMLGRITDVAQLATGRVAVAGALCPLDALRVERGR